MTNRSGTVAHDGPWGLGEAVVDFGDNRDGSLWVAIVALCFELSPCACGACLGGSLGVAGKVRK